MIVLLPNNNLAPAVAEFVAALDGASLRELDECLSEAQRLGDSAAIRGTLRVTWRNVVRLLRAERRRYEPRNRVTWDDEVRGANGRPIED